jgi:hypothetical protein
MLRRVDLVRADVSEEYIASIKMGRIGELGTLAVTFLEFLCGVLRLLVTANVPSSLVLVTLMMEALSSETSILIRITRRHIPKDSILRNHRRENLKSYKKLSVVLYGCET